MSLLGRRVSFESSMGLKKKADQQNILHDTNKLGPGIKQTQVAPTIVPAAPVVSSPSAVELIASREDVLTRASALGRVAAASREDVLTRASALGRGAATTGFKRFLAITEATKDRKDGPFRKLFNP